MAELAQVKDQIQKRNATIVAIGSGNLQMAKNFYKQSPFANDPIFELYVDPSLESFKEFQLPRSLWKTFKPSKKWISMLKASKELGVKMGSLQGDALQQGGIFVIGPGDALHCGFVNENTGDHANLEEVIKYL